MAAPISFAERVTRLAIASGVAPSEMPDYRKAVCPTDKTMTFLSLRAPLHLWHGEDDRTVSVSHSRWIASEVRSAELTVWPGEGHLHTPERWAEVYAAVAERIRPPGV
jgi:pimeloyl-ACP methyl ester carboxylesterase